MNDVANAGSSSREDVELGSMLSLSSVRLSGEYHDIIRSVLDINGLSSKLLCLVDRLVSSEIARM